MAVSISANPTVLVEEEGTVLTITLSSSEPIPEGGLVVTVDSETENALAQLDVFATEFENLRLVGVNDDTSGFSIRLTEQTGTLSLPIFDDDVADAIEGLTFTVQPGEGYTVDESASSISLTLQDAESTTIEPPPEVPEVPVDPIPSDNTPPVAQSDSYTVEAGEELSVDVDAGILANDSDAEGNQLIVSVLDTPDSGNLSLNEDGSFSYTPNEGFSGTDTFTYLINDGEIFSEPATVEIVVDAATTPEPPTPPTGELPTVSFNIEPDLVSEEDEQPTVFANFSVDGEIPEDGLSILIEGSLGLLDQVDGAIDVSFNDLAIGEFFDPENSITELVLSDNESSFVFPILNDVVQEEDQEFGFTVIENDGSIDSNYAVDSDDNSDSVTLIDGNGGAGVGPTVGFSLSQTELNEGEQFTVNFNVDGEIPEDGLTVLVDSETRGILGEFSIFDEDGNFAIQTTGIDGFPTVGDAGGSSFLATLTEPDASITLTTFDDGANEGLEEFSFTLIDGEIYEVDSNAQQVSFTIDDSEVPVIPTLEVPVVSANIEPDVVSEEDEGASFTLTLTVDGEIPTAELDADGAVISGGLPVLFDGTDVNPLFEQIAGDPIFNGVALGEFSDPEQPDLLEFVLLENTSSVTLNILNDVIQEEPQDLTFGILPDDEGLLDSNYTVNPDTASDTVTLVDDNGGAGVGPTVGLSISETELREGDEFTVNFNVDGEIPEDGLTVLVDSETPRVLGEFNLFDADGTPVFETTGIEGVPEVGDTGASSFLVNITEPEASISLSIFDDGANEGLEEVSFSLVDGEVYEVDSNAQQVAFSIDDSGISSETPSPTFGTIEADVIEVEGSSQIVFGGDSGDLIDASIGSTGNNRIYAGSGDDTLILGSGDRLVGGEGDDKFFALSGGDNILTGGAGADQFWIATAEIPEAANIITDFTSGEDVLGIAGLGIGFDDLSISQQDDNTLISANNSELAILQGIGVDNLVADNFAFG